MPHSLLFGSTAAAQHQHGKPGSTPEAFTATPAFGPDGTLWVVRPAVDRIVVQRSTDLGKTFAAPVTVTPEPMNLDWGPDARARIVVDPKGQLVVTFGTFQDKNFNGRAYFARSSDGGASFTQPRPITADTTSQRFEIAGVDPTGRVFAAWLDKRNVAKARAAGRAYPGAALAYAWEDGDAGFGDTSIALDNTCECCRLGLAFAGAGPAGRGVPQHLPGLGTRSWRDHLPRSRRRRDPCAASASTTGRSRPARITAPAWPSRPTARTTSPGSPTAPRARACSTPAPIPADAPYSQPRPLSAANRQPARPYLLANGSALHLVWKEFDGDKVAVRWQVSHDSGRQWSPPRTVAETADASDHPLLVADRQRAYLSWLTKNEGYRLIPLGDQP